MAIDFSGLVEADKGLIRLPLSTSRLRAATQAAELGYDVIGIDVSQKAVALAPGAFKQRQTSGIPLLNSDPKL